MKEKVLETANLWLNSPSIDKNDKEEIKKMIDGDYKILEDAFYRTLEFGTGGLRGVMGVGTNRMNKYVVGMATQGFANYLHSQFKNKISVVIANDSRINSNFFTDVAASVFSANGINVYIFDDIRPVPELSFALRYLACNAGVVITASHNPKEYNGYKVYWQDGGQVVSPHDKNIITEVQKIKTPDEVNFKKNEKLITVIGKEIDEKYFEYIKTLSLRPENNRKYNDIKIVYSPLHGTGYKILPEGLSRFGFNNIIQVPPQNIPDGNFPTVDSPNPEEKAGLQMSIDKAIETDADILMATDPDCDRLGVGVRIAKGQYELYNGNQTFALLTYYLLKTKHELNQLNDKQMVVTTIVTSDLINEITKHYNIKIFEVLTGFKNIADIINKYEGKYIFICGGEESYGFSAGDYVRDKDAVVTACLMCETLAWAKSQNKTLNDIMIDIAIQHGLYREALVSIFKKGISGMQDISNMMEEFRNNIPKSLCNNKIAKVFDYKYQTIKNITSNNIEKIKDIPASNVIQYLLEDGSKVTMRPSGTEPKIKFYFSVKSSISNASEYEDAFKKLDIYIENLKKELKIS